MPSDLFGLDDKIRSLCGDVLAGVDEAGRGPWAGPVVSAVVILPPGVRIQGVNDSKLLSPDRRDQLYERIITLAQGWAVGIAGPEVIDKINILQATFQTMRQAVAGLFRSPNVVVVDGRLIPGLSLRQIAFPEADRRSASVAAASIIAKVTRDRLMMRAHDLYPHYGFNQHKGYGTEDHRRALERHGPCEIHRRSFEPVRLVQLKGSKSF